MSQEKMLIRTSSKVLKDVKKSVLDRVLYDLVTLYIPKTDVMKIKSTDIQQKKS